ncbi:hypothetical protein C5167_048558 [Papaver somniferum]|uniref:Uncharacterized protein n=1 Tax=Papaver somniferum TaxID=3469 RepID=A0A4Y7KL71_PAPSO|nr:hypothetical protein C5167_048558 [Papaver somniferum]
MQQTYPAQEAFFIFDCSRATKEAFFILAVRLASTNSPKIFFFCNGPYGCSKRAGRLGMHSILLPHPTTTYIKVPNCPPLLATSLKS